MNAMRLVVLGLTLSSSWGNGHATTYRALLRAVAERGHDVLFLERDVPWYAAHRDLGTPDFCRLALYSDLVDLNAWRREIREADAVLVGSYVTDGIAVGRLVQRTALGVTAFYDIDTPVSLAGLARGDATYISLALIEGYDLYLTFTGGLTPARIEREYGARAARQLYCSADPRDYRPLDEPRRWDLSYLGTYSKDRQPMVERLLLEPARRLPARRFAVAGPLYPADIAWPENVDRLEHVPPAQHAAFYAASRFTLNVTREDMVRAGYSPSVRLFEAGACGVPVISDRWAGIETVLEPGFEIVLADTADDVVATLETITPGERDTMAKRIRARVLREHTAAHRAAELEFHLREAAARRASQGSAA